MVFGVFLFGATAHFLHDKKVLNVDRKLQALPTVMETILLRQACSVGFEVQRKLLLLSAQLELLVRVL